jgi:hypothetical protein
VSIAFWNKFCPVDCNRASAACLILLPCRTSPAIFNQHGYWEQKGLTSALTDQGPYEFAVSGAGDEYIDLSNTYLFVEAKIVADEVLDKSMYSPPAPLTANS